MFIPNELNTKKEKTLFPDLNLFILVEGGHALYWPHVSPRNVFLYFRGGSCEMT